jgi:hypothetical protein
VIRFHGSISDSGEVLELFSDFFDHFVSSLSDSFHTESGEPIRKHSTDQQTGEDEGVHNVDGDDGVFVIGVGSSG